MSSCREVLVVVYRDRSAFKRDRRRHWYHIPVDSAAKWVRDRWPPQWLAFYDEKDFAIRYCARVLDVRRVDRGEILFDQPHKVALPYYQLLLGDLQKRPSPIPSRRRRHITFIPTTCAKFNNAAEINDLFDDSPLEDQLWVELKRQRISAERQVFVRANDQYYALDFAIYCMLGELDVETDGDRWHANAERSKADNLRDNDLQTAGWRVLRFTTVQVREQMADYCLPLIVQNIRHLGGADAPQTLPWSIGTVPPAHRLRPPVL